MAITEMSLPIDIPWKRMAVSEDMIAPVANDLRFPRKWSSSVSVFYHEPTELPPEYCTRKITYLKVVCTITNYQTDEAIDVTILDELREMYGEYYGTWKPFSYLTQSYPCYGALLQIAVFPNPADGVALHDFPYVSSFQPTKREMYETVTESGEAASQSGSRVNVLKGTTGTVTNEDYNLYMGGESHSAVFGAYSGQEGQKQVGDINRTQTENQNLTTTDASREKRESLAYSTSMNQLYSLLQGYHLGTNRVLFFMQPRPHIQDTKFTFIQGLRRLEGIQEFFLIVNRPASIPGFCVEVALETAHAVQERAYHPRLIPISDLYLSGNLNKTAAALGINAGNYPVEANLVATWNRSSTWERWLAIHYLDADVGWRTIDFYVQQGQFTWDNFSRLQTVTRLFPDIGLEDLALIFEEYEGNLNEFFVTGRRLHSCATSVPEEEREEGEADCERSDAKHISKYKEDPSIVFEIKSSDLPHATISSRNSNMAFTQNAMTQKINAALWSSLGSPRRFPYGAVSFLETDFILNEMSQLIRMLGKAGIQDRPLEDIEDLRPLFENGLGQSKRARSIIDLGTLSNSMLARDLNVTELEARKIRRKLLVASLKSLDVGTIRGTINPENPILETFNREFPPDRVRDFERSARIYVGERDRPAPRSGLSWLIRKFSHFFYVPH